MLYTVTSLGADQQFHRATVEADSVDAARARVATDRAPVVSVVPAGLLERLSAPRPVRFPLNLFTQELLALLESGVSVVEAVETLAEKENRPGVRQVLLALVQALHEGKPLSAALAEAPHAFNALYVATVGASEKTGALNDALRRYAAYANQLEALRAKLVSAAIYPALLVSVSVLVILFLMGYVIPRFAHIYEDMGSKLPFMSRVLMHAGQGIAEYWPVMLAAFIAGGALLARGGAASLQGTLLRQLWRIPAVGRQLRVFQLVRMYRTLGMLLRGGVAVVQASNMVAGLLDTELRADLARATEQVSHGQPVSQSFEAQGLTTPVALRLLRVGERAGNMGEMMERIAAFHDEEIARWADWATRMIGPLLMLVMGLVIGAIVVLMYLPIFQLAESVR